MKHNLKLITKFMAVSVLLVVLSSCEKDLYEDQIYKDNLAKKIKMVQKPFGELLLNEQFNTAYQKVTKTKAKTVAQGKSALEEQYGFTIVDAVPSKIITEEGKEGTTYIMLVERPIKEDLKFENLIMTVTDEKTEAYIIKYTLAEKAKRAEEHDAIAMDIIKTESTNLKINAGSDNNGPCFSTFMFMCDDIGNGSWEHDHVATNFCLTHSNNLYVVVVEYCVPEGAGGNVETGSTTTGTTSSTGSGSSTGSNSGGASSPIPSSPIPCVACIKDDDKPCANIKRKTSSTAYMNKFNNLNTPSKFTLNYESGFSETATNGVVSYPNNTVIPSTNSTISMQMAPGSYAYTHVHVDTLIVCEDGVTRDLAIKIHSPKDLIQIVGSSRNNAIASGMNATDVYGVVISDQGIFALTLVDNSIIETSTFTNNYANFRNTYEFEANEILVNDSLSNEDKKEALQLLLLKGIKKLGLENKVALFEGEVEIEVGNKKKLNWTRKTLSTDNNSVIPNPC